MLRTILKPLSFVPALIMMYIIFSFSAQDGDMSGQLSYQASVKIIFITVDFIKARVYNQKNKAVSADEDYKFCCF